MTIAEEYNRWAGSYDSADNKTRDMEKSVARKILSAYDFQNVIELGCGTGKNTDWLSRQAGSITAIDFSREMLKIAKAKVSERNVKFIQADLNESWPVSNESGDLIVCSLTLEHIRDLNFIFTEAKNKLVTGGLFYICELHPFKQYAGSKAKYNAEGKIVELETFIHHFSEYVNSAFDNGFKLIRLDEWFDEDSVKTIPRLVSFLFKG